MYFFKANEPMMSLKNYFYLFILTVLSGLSESNMWLTLTDEAIMNGLTNSPNITDPGLICDKIKGLQEKHKNICYRNPAIILAVGEANRRTLEHLQKVFEEDQLPASLLIYKSLFSFRIADSSKREIVYLASIRTSAIAHELAIVCSDGISKTYALVTGPHRILRIRITKPFWVCH